ncbi:DUF2512 family protein [Paenibacillus chartarius]|uniref:DUF2512 family protein n=1 Tax=Paenibacillus chartarius TaxID=747481 RepID=A0ABV6DL83_9BACL
MNALLESRFFWKLLVNGAALVAMLMWFTGISFGASLIIAVLLASTAYVVGDKIILRWTNNLVATAADFGLVFVALWFIAWRSNLDYSWLELTVTSAVIAAIEYMYHLFLFGYDKPEKIW